MRGKLLIKRWLALFIVLIFTASPVQAAQVKKESTWVVKSGKVFYYDARGIKTTGMKKIGTNQYYFDKQGVQQTGWQLIRGNYYFFRVHDGKKGNMVKSAKVNGIALSKDGKAQKSNTSLRKLKIMYSANKVVKSITNGKMSKTQKLRKCFDYTKKTYTYRTWRRFSPSKNWDQAYAEDMLYKGKGNCFSYAAVFAYMANAVGYSDVYVVSDGGHGWAEIKGKVYDPDWALVSKVDSYFGMSYDLSGKNGRPNYKKYKAYSVKI